MRADGFIAANTFTSDYIVFREASKQMYIWSNLANSINFEVCIDLLPILKLNPSKPG